MTGRSGRHRVAEQGVGVLMCHHLAEPGRTEACRLIWISVVRLPQPVTRPSLTQAEYSSPVALRVKALHSDTRPLLLVGKRVLVRVGTGTRGSWMPSASSSASTPATRAGTASGR